MLPSAAWALGSLFPHPDRRRASSARRLDASAPLPTSRNLQLQHAASAKRCLAWELRARAHRPTQRGMEQVQWRAGVPATRIMVTSRISSAASFFMVSRVDVSSTAVALSSDMCARSDSSTCLSARCVFWPWSLQVTKIMHVLDGVGWSSI